jgi:hypothetical protein
LVAALVAAISDRELTAIRSAARIAPGPLSALATAVATFATRALRNRRLAWAVIGEPVDAEIDVLRLGYRRAFTAELEQHIMAAVDSGYLPDQDTKLAAPALAGALLEGLIGPLAQPAEDPRQARAAVQMVTLLVLRALGVGDARARGLVVQIQMTDDNAA